MTGASGYVGGHLVTRLIAQGWQVHALVRPSTTSRPPAAIVHVADAGEIGEVIQAACPDVCFHLAGKVTNGHHPHEVAELIAANVAFGTAVAAAIALTPGRLFVNAGTFWQHKGGASYAPTTLYAAAKEAFRDILAYYASEEGLHVVDLVLFDNYGPSDPRSKLCNLLDQASRTGEPVPLTAGEQLVDLLHVEDVAHAFAHAACSHPVPDLVTGYAVQSGAPVSIRSLVADFEQATGRPVPVQWGARSYSGQEMWEPWDVGPGLPGWSPRRTLREGLRDVYGVDR